MADAGRDAAQRLAAALDRIARASADAAALRARLATQAMAAQAMATQAITSQAMAMQPPDAVDAASLHPVELEALRDRLDSLIDRLRDGLAELA